MCSVTEEALATPSNPRPNEPPTWTRPCKVVLDDEESGTMGDTIGPDSDDHTELGVGIQASSAAALCTAFRGESGSLGPSSHGKAVSKDCRYRTQALNVGSEGPWDDGRWATADSGTMHGAQVQ